MLYLRKLLPAFFLPIGLTIALVLAGLRWRKRGLAVAGIVLLWLCSTPAVIAVLVRAAEGYATRAPADDAPSADAIVVLSGGRSVAPGPARISEWGDPDRFFGGIELYQAGKAPLLVFTGGEAPWEPNAPTEGAMLSKFAVQLGVPADRALTTGAVISTSTEARAVAALLHERLPARSDNAAPRVLLVTSAYHMQRARRLFEREHLTILPFPVDFLQPAGATLDVRDFFPRAEALENTERVWREIYARIFYRTLW